ncbi:hypothetical protein CXG81DRAFT_10913 [Caulochytrium protostelioides]|uniref:SGS-domain-containing protein n=1 Tax=Caulochytrium protostelioides TaxID=1555241 RepID=A0A4P9XAD2_9FUNG|nr:hypothetical protein CXG81DRAFT_10913 [Caulochytrium protostelioides]|eukprot:RKP02333.1 hypothetical protein CXG81DRAFT_10913 [Caulochytrium protostelioides]
MNSSSLPTASSGSALRHEFFQTDTFVTISVFAKNLDPATVSVTFEPTRLHLQGRLPPPPPAADSDAAAPQDGAPFELTWSPLTAEIVPEGSRYEVLKTKIELKLKKAQEGVRWPSVEGTPMQGALPATMAPLPSGTSAAAQAAASTPAAVYPTSSKKPKNWDQIEKAIEAETDEKPEGQAALNALFQQIYQNADDATRRAMIKSYTESGGTALSTNWQDVSKGPVPVTPPEGMEARKFDQ